jgi:hypothetical protein
MIEIAGAPAGSAAVPNTATNTAANGAAAKERVRSTADAPAAAFPEVGPLQRICLAVLRAEWTTVALVAADPSAPVRPLADALADVSRAYGLRPLRILDGAGASPAHVALLQHELSAARAGDGRVAIAIDDLRKTPGGVPLVVQADAVVLVVRLGVTALRDVEETAELVGRERVLGCVVAR